MHYNKVKETKNFSEKSSGGGGVSVSGINNLLNYGESQNEVRFILVRSR